VAGSLPRLRVTIRLHVTTRLRVTIGLEIARRR
jgi:hypothetical protein